MLFVKYDIEKTLSNALKTKNKALINKIVLDETAKLIVNKKDHVIKALNKSKIFVDYNTKNVNVLKTVQENLNNVELRKNLIALIMQHNKVQTNDKSFDGLDEYFSFDSKTLEQSVSQHNEIKTTLERQANGTEISIKNVLVYSFFVSAAIYGLGYLAWRYLLWYEQKDVQVSEPTNVPVNEPTPAATPAATPTPTPIQNQPAAPVNVPVNSNEPIPTT